VSNTIPAALARAIVEDQRHDPSSDGTELPPQLPAARTAGSLSARRRSLAYPANGTSCIEIDLAHSGVRMVLSRVSDVWLLSIQSASPLDSTQREHLVEMLRAQFAERGLGAVDIIA